MAPPLSVNSQMSFGVQSVKGTPITTGLISPRLQTSNMVTVYSYAEPPPEHFNAADDRPLARKSGAYRTGYTVAWGGRGRAYPSAIGEALRMAGFDVATATGSGGEKEHTFTIADRDDAAWGTVIKRTGEGANQYTQRCTDARIMQLMFDTSVEGVNWSFNGRGLTIDNSPETETITEEENTPFTPTQGTLVADIGGSAITSEILSSRINITNPLDMSAQPLFSGLEHTDMSQQGIAVQGTLGGIDVSEDLIRRMQFGGATGTGPVITIPELTLGITITSAADIDGNTVPFSLSYTVPVAEARLAPWGSVGQNLIRTNISWTMLLPPASEPLTIFIVNETASY